MSFISGHFYKYRKNLEGLSRISLRLGSVYKFETQNDLFPTPKKEFILLNAIGERFDIICSYEILDQFPLDEIFEEVPKPSWWDNPGVPSGY